MCFPRRLVLPVCFAALAAGALAQTFTFTRVVDTATTLPGGTGTFQSLGTTLAIDSTGRIAFADEGASNKGVYVHSAGTTTKVADLSTAIPGGTGNFTGFTLANGALAPGQLAFRGAGGSGQSGVYAYDGTTLSLLANLGTAIPDGVSTFTSFQVGSASGTRYGLVGSGVSQQQGAYVFDGATLTTLANKSMTAPRIGGTFSSFTSQLALNQGDAAFFAGVTGGSNPGSAVLAYSGGVLRTVAATGEAAAGTGLTFGNMTSQMALDGSTLLFRAGFGPSNSRNGLFATPVAGGALTLVVDNTALVPGRAETFTFVNGPEISGATYLFHGTYASGTGLFYSKDGTLGTILTTADLLDGKALTSLGFAGVAGDTMAFAATFTDGSRGIYSTSLTAIPEPSAIALLAGGAALGLVVWRRRLRSVPG
jgi:hypothetical protein